MEDGNMLEAVVGGLVGAVIGSLGSYVVGWWSENERKSKQAKMDIAKACYKIAHDILVLERRPQGDYDDVAEEDITPPSVTRRAENLHDRIPDIWDKKLRSKLYKAFEQKYESQSQMAEKLVQLYDELIQDVKPTFVAVKEDMDDGPSTEGDDLEGLLEPPPDWRMPQHPDWEYKLKHQPGNAGPYGTSDSETVRRNMKN